MLDVVVGWTVVVSIMVFVGRGPMERMVEVMVWRAVSSLTWGMLVAWMEYCIVRRTHGDEYYIAGVNQFCDR